MYRLLLFFFYFSFVSSFLLQDNIYNFFQKPLHYSIYCKDASLTIQSKYKTNHYKMFFNSLQKISKLFVSDSEVFITKTLHKEGKLHLDWNVHLFLNIFAFLCLEGKSIYLFNKDNKIQEHFLSFQINSIGFQLPIGNNSICCKKNDCSSKFKCKPNNYHHPLLKKPIRVRL